jgi:hypothetical protein
LNTQKLGAETDPSSTSAHPAAFVRKSYATRYRSGRSGGAGGLGAAAALGTLCGPRNAG